ncbi:MAG: DDE-type integrase/transposase/recombinase [Flavobacteriaceae bacterium]|nr:DDE-type integrase/transposase/recombinase [Flavobacteriaceae bacterium]
MTEPNQVWATDITYIPIQGGSLYLCAMMDHDRRYVVGWDLSNAATSECCLSVWNPSMDRCGIPQIL